MPGGEENVKSCDALVWLTPVTVLVKASFASVLTTYKAACCVCPLVASTTAVILETDPAAPVPKP